MGSPALAAIIILAILCPLSSVDAVSAKLISGAYAEQVTKFHTDRNFLHVAPFYTEHCQICVNGACLSPDHYWRAFMTHVDEITSTWKTSTYSDKSMHVVGEWSTFVKFANGESVLYSMAGLHQFTDQGYLMKAIYVISDLDLERLDEAMKDLPQEEEIATKVKEDAPEQ